MSRIKYLRGGRFRGEGTLSTIAFVTITIVIMIAVAVIITGTVALAVRATRRRLPTTHTPGYWRDTARACELEWSASHRID